MTYPIHPGPSFRAADIEGSRQTHTLSLSFQNFSVQGRRLTVCSSIAASHHHEGNCLIYGPLASILFDQGFPVEYEFNTAHTGNTFSRPQD